jgi:hypothetical protein
VSLPQIFGLILAALHAGVVAYLVWNIFFAGEPDWPMLWTVLLIIDFPWSLLTFPVAWSLRSMGIHARQPKARALDPENFLLPFIFLGLGGTIWWFFLPQWVAWIYGRIAG